MDAILGRRRRMYVCTYARSWGARVREPCCWPFWPWKRNCMVLLFVCKHFILISNFYKHLGSALLGAGVRGLVIIQFNGPFLSRLTGRLRTAVLADTYPITPGTQCQKPTKLIPSLRIENLKNYTLSRSTYLYSSCMGVLTPAPSGVWVIRELCAGFVVCIIQGRMLCRFLATNTLFTANWGHSVENKVCLLNMLIIGTNKVLEQFCVAFQSQERSDAWTGHCICFYPTLIFDVFFSFPVTKSHFAKYPVPILPF